MHFLKKILLFFYCIHVLTAGAMFRALQSTPSLFEVCQLLDQQFLDPSSKAKLIKTLDDITEKANFKSSYSSVHVLKEAQKHQIINDSYNKSVSYKNFLQMLSTGAFSHIIRQSRLKNGDYFTQNKNFDFARNEYEAFINSLQRNEDSLKLLTHYYSDLGSDKKRTLETIDKLTNLVKSSFNQEDIHNLTMDYSVSEYTQRSRYETKESCHDLFYQKNVPDSNSSRLFHEALHFSQRPYSLPESIEQINMITYSWQIGKLLASEPVRSHTKIKTIKDISDLLVLGDINQKVCSKDGYFYSVSETEALISDGILQHDLVDSFLFDSFHNRSEVLPSSLESQTIRSVQSLNDLEEDKRKQLIKAWLLVKKQDGSYNKKLIKKFGEYSKFAEQLLSKVDQIYQQRFSQISTQEMVCSLQEVLILAKANRYYTASWNPSSLLPQGYPLRPMDEEGSTLWDYFVLFSRPSAEYIEFYQLLSNQRSTSSFFQGSILSGQAITASETYALGGVPQAIPVIPSAPPKD